MYSSVALRGPVLSLTEENSAAKLVALVKASLRTPHHLRTHILVDQLVSLGVQEHVAAILHLIVTEPVLKDVSEMFGLPIAKGLRSTVSLPT